MKSAKDFINGLNIRDLVIDREFDGTTIVSKWNWDYSDALEAQKKCLQFVRENRAARILICCSHPHVFTVGRGLQKGKTEELKALVDFDMGMVKQLSFPVHKINRGGGLTFHYPGQWIIYPIVNLNNPDFNLKTLTYWLLEKVKVVIEKEFSLHGLDYDRPLLGLWCGRTKVASVGIGVEHFVTYHGLALNLTRDAFMFKELSRINPCGLSALSYSCLSDHVDAGMHDGMLGRFHRTFCHETERELQLKFLPQP